MILNTLVVTVSLFSAMHPLHVAYSNIDISTDQKTVSVAHKVFTEDFTQLFLHLFEKNIVPHEGTEFSRDEIDLINHYMNYRFILVAGSDTVDLKYISKQHDAEYLYLYFKGSLEKPELSDFTINNLLLLDLNLDQTNLVIVNYGSVEKGLAFNWDHRQAVVVLKE